MDESIYIEEKKKINLINGRAPRRGSVEFIF